MRTDIAVAIAVMAAASYACRIGGYVAMHGIAITPRIERWLSALPIALIGAMLGPIAYQGTIAERAAIVVAAVMMRITGNELSSVLAAVAVVAGLRATA